MRKNWMLLAVGLLAAILALGAIACGDDDDDNGNGGDQPTATAPAESAEIAPVTLAQEGDSGVTGSATITETATGGSEVVVTIDGGLEPGTHQNHIHHGSCAEQGEVHVPLTDLEAGEDGSAPATTTSVDPETNVEDPPFTHWLDSPHYIAAHALDGAVVTCGDVMAAS